MDTHTDHPLRVWDRTCPACTALQAGPCVVCGETNYPLSFGGPTICPACDCGVDPKVAKLRKIVNELTRENIVLLKRALDAEEKLARATGLEHSAGSSEA